MTGDSHTNFDDRAFTAGAVGGAAMIAGAIGAGIANLRASRETDHLSWTADMLRQALHLSELFRARELAQLRDAVETISERDRTIADLTRQLRVEQALRTRRR